MTPSPTLAGAPATADSPTNKSSVSDVSGKPYRVGTLAYNKRDLFVLFFWLIVGDVVFMIVDQIEPKVLPIFLKLHGATDQQIAIIVGSFSAAISLCVNPIVFGALAVFVLNYWIVGIAETHPHEIFVGAAVLYLVGFLAMCRFVKEGDYPPVEEEKPRAAVVARFAPLRAARTFVRESYRSPVYWWTYFTRTMFYASMTVMSFVLFFARDELGLSYDQAGKLMSWSSFAWLAIAYPMGRLLDRWGGVRTLNLALWLLAVTYAASFFGIVGEKTFLVFSVVNGIAYWMAMLSSIMLVQQIFHPMRMGQLSAANVIFQSVIIALLVSPATGWVFDTLKGLDATLALPLVGEVTVGSYRFVYLILAALCFAALFGLQRVRMH